MPTVPNLKPDPLLPQYRYNLAAKRYVGQNGRFVSQQTIRLELDKTLDNITKELVNTSRAFRAGTIDGKAFQETSMALIKQTHLAAGSMEKGGWFNMTQADFGRVGNITRQEYDWFRGLTNEILSGKQRLDGTLDNRIALYGQAGRETYHVFQREDRAIQGYDEERSVLNGRDNCEASSRPGCIGEAAKSWQPIGKIAMIGTRTCLSRCRCDLEYRRSDTGETV